MIIRIFETEEQVTTAAAAIIAAQLIEEPETVLGLATGTSPLGVYDELTRLCEAGVVSFMDVQTFNLDEYIGLDYDHEQSYHRFMEENLFSRVDLLAENTHTLDGATKDPEAECEAFEEQIDEAGGIDLQFLGIGCNGHIGFNEPAASFSAVTHVQSLTPSTIEANARFFANASEVPREAMTMGIGTIMAAQRIVLVAMGEHKAQAVRDMYEGPIDPACPASILQIHPNITVLVDEAAASLLAFEDEVF